jgi:phosphopantothenoylcysteine decarboxylase/phosphopantothenate--cysteine ligase
MDHIRLARWPDIILIAPASANLLARLRAGMADDLLTTLCLASDQPILLAPAMNSGMWENPATRDNVRVLMERRMRFLGPESGDMACGETGTGRMQEPLAILEHLQSELAQTGLGGLSILISAGPTREPIDPVRFLSNRSSGKMGYALAQAALDRGARVTLVSGPVSLHPPRGVNLIAVETAAEMHAAVLSGAGSHDIYIGAAAVADYAPVMPSEQKLKKSANELHLDLKKTPDILMELSRLKPRPFLVGFAAETHELEAYARGKLHEKSLDLIAANWVGGSRGGFDRDENALQVFWDQGSEVLSLAPKWKIAQQLLELVQQHYHAKNPV